MILSCLFKNKLQKLCCVSKADKQNPTNLICTSCLSEIHFCPKDYYNVFRSE